MKLFSFFAAFLALLAGVSAQQRTIVETAIATPQLSTLVSVLTTPGYEPVLNALSGPGPFTVFAPNNDAFARAGVDPSQVDFVTQVLYYHVLSGEVLSGDLAPLQFVETLMTDSRYVTLGGEGQKFGVSVDGGRVTIDWGQGQATVVLADIQCSNGVVHIIDEVIVPFPANTADTAAEAGLNTLLDAVVRTGLADAVVNTPQLTIFAPTDEAFAAVPGLPDLTLEQLAEILTYHVVPAVAFSTDLSNGQIIPTLNGNTLRVDLTRGVMINDANVIAANVLTQNGVVHVIDKVLVPPAKLAEIINKPIQADPSRTIVENAIATPELSTLVAVLTTPGYEPVLNALSGPGPFTVFAPNNDAFARAGVDPSQVDFVTQVLNYHVLSGTVLSRDLAPLQFPEMLMNDPRYVTLNGEGQKIEVAVNNGRVTVSWGLGLSATVVLADVVCSNGVVHIIDEVIVPFPADTAETAAAAGLTTLLDAVVRAGLADAVINTPGLTIFAPTNEAFAAVPGLPDLTIEQLTAILTYHVVPAVAFSTDLSDGQILPTLNGNTLRVDLSRGVRINDANVALANALIKNGVVHVIDTVLIPPTMQ